MANQEAKNSQRAFPWLEFGLRIIVVVANITAILLTVTNSQVIYVMGLKFEADWSYEKSFKFLVAANAIICGSTFGSLVLAFFSHSRNSHRFLLFLHDLLTASLALATCAAATSIGLVAKNGNPHMGWTGICFQLQKFCNRATFALVFSYVGWVVLLVLAISSASRLRQIQAK